MTGTTHRAIAAVLVLAATLTTACDKNEQPATASPTTAAPATSSPTDGPTSAAPQTREQASQAAIDAYIGMQNTFLKAGQLGDPAHPDLAKYATDRALTRLIDGLKSYQSKGLLIRGEAVYHPKVESLAPADAPTKAQVRDCMDTSKTSLYKANGDPYQDTPGGLRLVLADIARINDTWKATGFGVREVGSCV